MANFKHYFDTRFAACRCIAKTYDQHRDRNVDIFQIPGQVDCVGVSDGVDRWVAPVAPELFSIDIQKVLRDLQADPSMKLPVTVSNRAAAPRGRVKLISARVPLVEEPQTRGRRQLLN